MEEKWKDIYFTDKGKIYDYRGYYQVSNLGRIKSLYTKSILKPVLNHNGHLRICLVKDKIKRSFFVHRIVANLFLQNPNNLPQINHKNENKQDNSVENLEWCTAKYNTNYGTRNERIKGKLGTKIAQYDFNEKLIKIWNSMAEIERSLKISKSDICMCCKGKLKTRKGFIWKYLEKEMMNNAQSFN